jgi:hypothetical protein
VGVWLWLRCGLQASLTPPRTSAPSAVRPTLDPHPRTLTSPSLLPPRLRVVRTPPLPTLSVCVVGWIADESWSLLSVVHPNPRVAARTSMPSASAAAAATGSTAAASTAPSGASAAKPSMPPSVSTEYAYIPPKAHASTTPASAPAGTGEETTSRCYVVAVKHL